MVLRKEFLDKPMRKSRQTAVDLLTRLANASGLPPPQYDFEMQGYAKRPKHFCKVRFRVPDFIRKEGEFLSFNVSGAGRCAKKTNAKSLAALEAVMLLEESLGLTNGGLMGRLEKIEEDLKKRKEEMKAIPVDKAIPGVTWANLPMDMNFIDTAPASRKGNVEFHPGVMQNSKALTAAKAITLTATEFLPRVSLHANNSDEGIQRFANIKTGGRMVDVTGNRPQDSLNIEENQSEVIALERLYKQIEKHSKPFYENDKSSFGMAKMFVRLPRHQFAELNELLAQVKENPVYRKRKQPRYSTSRHSRRRTQYHDDASMVKSRLTTFRIHQRKTKLPVDSIENQIPHDAAVTIVRGGTGSGKTTRYPLMLSLLSSDPATKVLVAQPRRLACQTAARRVAFEQDSQIGTVDCPIGYSIRFESFPASADGRTVDFQTPGVILRRATEDPLLQNVTHLCIDEVHERNADMDLLLALAKQAMKKRENHDTLPPLRLVLMSATLDSSQWESFFSEREGGTRSIKLLDVPDVRRFPIQVVHLEEKGIPSHLKAFGLLQRHKRVENYDEVICEATAQLASFLFANNQHQGGSILCFLPGIEEIRYADRLIQKSFSRALSPTIKYLHSSLSSDEQASVFEPGPKIILSTNLAETSVTIPDVNVVIDSGRERQFSLLESTALSENATVVGSQLVTVDISKAAAKQRAGRTGRVAPGVCYRLYTPETYARFDEFTKPEMLRMDVSQLVLHTLSLARPETMHPLHFLMGAPNPPTVPRLRQTLVGLSYQGHVEYDLADPDNIQLTPMGKVASLLPASPRIGRMMVMALMLRSIDSAVAVAALLSIPKLFQLAGKSNFDWELTDTEVGSTSDIVKVLESYQAFIKKSERGKAMDPLRSQFRQAIQVEQQLGHAIKNIVRHAGMDVTEANWAAWNFNSNRVGALLGVVCGASPHIAHLVNGRNEFATRDVPGTARIFPGSVNASPKRRVHWYLYNELRTTKMPYLHITTAASPLELALFCESSDIDVDVGPANHPYDLHGDEYAFIADQWVPVTIPSRPQREPFLELRRLLTNDMLQQVSQDPKSVLENTTYQRIVLFVLSALEQQRITK